MMEKLFVIKIGGNVIDDDVALASFLEAFSCVAAKKILVHGGGKIATRIGEKLGISSNYINGRRITDEHTIDLVTMVYGGLVNKKMVARLQAVHCNAIGLTGADANVLAASIRPVKEINYGFAGDLDHTQFDSQPWQLFLEHGLVPVVAPLTHDGKGQLLNTNADTIASALAVGLSKRYDVRLIFCFEKKGVLEDIQDESSVIRRMDKDTYVHLKAGGKLFAGILPKIDNAFAAIEAGVREVLIGDAKDLLQNVTNDTKGSLIV